jgi:hypothetical protein
VVPIIVEPKNQMDISSYLKGIIKTCTGLKEKLKRFKLTKYNNKCKITFEICNNNYYNEILIIIQQYVLVT